MIVDENNECDGSDEKLDEDEGEGEGEEIWDFGGNGGKVSGGIVRGGKEDDNDDETELIKDFCIGAGDEVGRDTADDCTKRDAPFDIDGDEEAVNLSNGNVGTTVSLTGSGINPCVFVPYIIVDVKSVSVVVNFS